MMRTEPRPRLEELVVGADYLLYDNPLLYELMLPDPDFDSARWIAAVAARFGGARTILDVGCGLWANSLTQSRRSTARSSTTTRTRPSSPLCATSRGILYRAAC
jgi:hypothetical protein